MHCYKMTQVDVTSNVLPEMPACVRVPCMSNFGKMNLWISDARLVQLSKNRVRPVLQIYFSIWTADPIIWKEHCIHKRLYSSTEETPTGKLSKSPWCFSGLSVCPFCTLAGNLLVYGFQFLRGYRDETSFPPPVVTIIPNKGPRVTFGSLAPRYRFTGDLKCRQNTTIRGLK